MITLTLTPEKAEALAGCLDAVRKAAPIEGAKVAIELYGDLMQAVEASKKPTKRPTTKRRIGPRKK